MSSIMAFFYSATFCVRQRTDKNMPVGETRKVVGVSRTYGRSACVCDSRVLATDSMHEVYVVDFLYNWIFIEQVAGRSVDLDNKRSPFKQKDRGFLRLLKLC